MDETMYESRGDAPWNRDQTRETVENYLSASNEREPHYDESEDDAPRLDKRLNRALRVANLKLDVVEAAKSFRQYGIAQETTAWWNLRDAVDKLLAQIAEDAAAQAARAREEEGEG